VPEPEQGDAGQFDGRQCRIQIKLKAHKQHKVDAAIAKA